MDVSSLPLPAIAEWGPVVLRRVHDLPASTFDEDAEVIVRKGGPISEIPTIDSARPVVVTQAPTPTWDETFTVSIIPGVAPISRFFD